MSARNTNKFYTSTKCSIYTVSHALSDLRIVNSQNNTSRVYTVYRPFRIRYIMSSSSEEDELLKKNMTGHLSCNDRTFLSNNNISRHFYSNLFFVNAHVIIRKVRLLSVQLIYRKSVEQLQIYIESIQHIPYWALHKTLHKCYRLTYTIF